MPRVPPDPTASGVSPAEEAFTSLLTLFDIEPLLAAPVDGLGSELIDYKAMAEQVDPAQVTNMDSWYGLSTETSAGTKGMTLSVIDFDSAPSALAHFGIVKSGTPGMQDMTQPIGDASIQLELNAQGIGSMLVFLSGDRVVSLHTAQSDDQQPLVSLEGLEALARLVASRL